MRRFLAVLPLCLLALVACLSSADAKPRRSIAPVPMEDCFTSGPVVKCTTWYHAGSGQAEAVTVKRGKKVRVARKVQSSGGFGEGGYLVSKARAYMGQTASQIGLSRHTLWCAAFIAEAVAPHLKSRVRNPNMARDYASLPRVAPQVGAIAVLSRGKRGGHIGIVTGFDTRGNPIIVSGNHNRRVGEAAYPRHRVIAYVSAS